MINVFDEILNFSKKSSKLLLPNEGISYNQFYKLTQRYYKFLKKI